MQIDDLFEEHRFGTGDILDGLARHGIRKEPDEITGMAGVECHADLAVGLESADARAMSGARVDDDERPARRIELDAGRWNDPDERVIDRPIERAAIDKELHLVVEHMRGGLSQMLAVLVAAPAHDVPEQHAALRRVDHVFHRGAKCGKRRRGRSDRRWTFSARRHCLFLFVVSVLGVSG